MITSRENGKGKDGILRKSISLCYKYKGWSKSAFNPSLKIERKGPRKARSPKTQVNLLAYTQFARGSAKTPRDQFFENLKEIPKKGRIFGYRSSVGIRN